MGQCVSSAHLTALQDQISDAEQALTTCRTELSHQKQQLSTADAAAASSKDEIAELKLQIRDLTVQRDVKEKQRAEFEVALHKKVQDSEGQRRVLEAAKQEALREVGLKKRDIEKLGTQLHEVELEREKFRDDVTHVENELVIARASNKAQESRIANLESGNAELRQELIVLNTAVAELDEATEKLNAHWSTKLESVQQTHAAEEAATKERHADAVAVLKAELTATKNQHADALASIESSHAAALEQHNSEQNRSEASLSANVASLSAQLAAAHARHATTTAELVKARSDAKQEIMDVRGSVTKSSSRYERLRAEHDILIQSSEMLQAELSATRDELHVLKQKAAAGISHNGVQPDATVTDSIQDNTPAHAAGPIEVTIEDVKRTDSPMRSSVHEVVV